MRIFNTIIYVNDVDGGHMMGEVNADGVIESFEPVTLDLIIGVDRNVLHYVMIEEDSDGDFIVHNIQKYVVADNNIPIHLTVSDFLTPERLIVISNQIIENHQKLTKLLN
jgi:hypothetical protein